MREVRLNDRTDALIVFTPSGKRGRFPLGTPVLTAARSLGVDIDSVCGGRAICGRCQINVGEGEFAKHGITSAVDHLSAFSKVEERYDKLRGLASGRRLSCQTQLLADVVIDVPPESQVHKQVVRKAAEVRDIEMDPATRLYFIEVEEADMHKPSSDLERVYRALAEQWEVRDLTCNLSIISKLQAALKKGEWKITCAVNSRVAGGGNELVAIWPGFHDRIFGLAVDVGSTTVAAHLCNLTIRRCGGLRRPDEPADPFRRRPDEPRLLRDDESGRREGNDRRHPRGAEHACARKLPRKPRSSSRIFWKSSSSAIR